MYLNAVLHSIDAKTAGYSLNGASQLDLRRSETTTAVFSVGNFSDKADYVVRIAFVAFEVDLNASGSRLG